MNRRWIIALSLLLAAIFAGVTVHLLRQRTQAQQRKSVRAWTVDLYSPNQQVRDEAAAAIKALGPNAVPRLIRLLRDRDSPLKAPILKLSSNLPLPQRQWIFRRFSMIDAGTVRGLAAQALGLIGPDSKDAVPALNRALRDPERFVSWEAATALGRIGKDSVPTLVANLQDPNTQVRHAAVYALGLVGPPAQSAFLAVLQARSDPDPHLRTSAVHTLRSVDPQYVERLATIIAQNTGNMRELAINALPRRSFFSQAALPALLKLMQDQDASARRQALATLGAIQPWDKESFVAIVSALEDPVREIRTTATNVLVEAAAPATISLRALGEAAKDESALVREWAARLTARIKSPDQATVPVVELLSTDEESSVRQAATEASNKIPPDSATQPTPK